MSIKKVKSKQTIEIKIHTIISKFYYMLIIGLWIHSPFNS